jgi:hypothetical protein
VQVGRHGETSCLFPRQSSSAGKSMGCASVQCAHGLRSPSADGGLRTNHVRRVLCAAAPRRPTQTIRSSGMVFAQNGEPMIRLVPCVAVAERILLPGRDVLRPFLHTGSPRRSQVSWRCNSSSALPRRSGASSHPGSDALALQSMRQGTYSRIFHGYGPR